MSPLFNIATAILLLIFVQIPAAYAQDAVKLVFPPAGEGEPSLTFNVGDNVPLQWTCTFSTFTLQVWQGPDEEGAKAFRNLQSRSKPNTKIASALTNGAANVTDTSVRSMSWKAETIAGFSNDVPMHIRLFNPNDKDCETCNSRSKDFMIVGTNSTQASGSASPSATEASANASSSVRLGLGIGLGLGILIIIALTSIVTLFCLRRRWREPKIETADPYEAPLTAWKQSPPSTARGLEPPTAGYYATKEPKLQGGEIGGQGVMELQPELMRVEAPRDAERIELDGNVVQSSLSRKFSWQR